MGWAELPASLLNYTRLISAGSERATGQHPRGKTHLSRLVEDVARGAEIVIAKVGKPVARLVAVEDDEHVLLVYPGLSG